MNSDTSKYNKIFNADIEPDVSADAGFGENANSEGEVFEEKTRRKKKIRVKKKRKKKYYSLRFLILVVVCAALYFFLHSSVFSIEEINLEENYLYTTEKVQEISGLKIGANLFETNLKECEEKMEARPYVREADFSRKLPGTIEVTLDLRTPSFVLKGDGSYVLVDNEGCVLEHRKEMPHYTFLVGLTVTDATIGQTVEVKEEKLYQQYMKLIEEMNSADLYFRQMVIKDNMVKVHVNSGLYCVGTKKNMVEGMRDGNLKSVLYTLDKKGIEKGVVSVGDDKYYSYKKSEK